MARPKGTKNKQPSKKRNQHVAVNHVFDKKRALAFFQRGSNQSTILPLPRRTVGGLRDQVLKVKQCNCKRSSCLKLYCECFASGILCSSACCCVDCRNLDFESKKIASTMKMKNNASAQQQQGEAANNDVVEGDSPTTRKKKTSSTMRQNELEERYPDKTVNMRLQALISILDRNTHAFRPRAVNIANSSSTVLSQTLSQNVRSATAAASMAANSSSSNYASTSAAIMAKLRQDNKQKKSKVGCNCRKSFCLKKYCECFQAMIYCNAESCRCQDCQNKPGNPKREKLIMKSKKKVETKDSLPLATVKYNTATNTSSSNDNAAMIPDEHKKVGGVPEHIAAIVTTGVAAAGVDLFLPASSYTQSMKMKSGNVVSEVSFGMVGKQKVGGGKAKEDSDPSDLIFAAARSNDKDGEQFGEGGGPITPFVGFDHEKVESEIEKEKRLVLEEVKSHFDSLRVLLNGNRSSAHDEHESGETNDSNADGRKGKSWDDFVRDLEEKNTLSSSKCDDIEESKLETKLDEQNESKAIELNTDESQDRDAKVDMPKIDPPSDKVETSQPKNDPKGDDAESKELRKDLVSEEVKDKETKITDVNATANLKATPEVNGTETSKLKLDDKKSISRTRKRSHEELARKSMIEMGSFVSRFQSAVDEAGRHAEKKFDGIVSQLKLSRNKNDWWNDIQSDPMRESNSTSQNLERQDLIQCQVPSRLDRHVDGDYELSSKSDIDTVDELACSEEIFDETNSSNLHESNKSTSNQGSFISKSNAMEMHQTRTNSEAPVDELECYEELKNSIIPNDQGSSDRSHDQERLTGPAIKELYLLAAQDTALLHELAAMIREQALTLARKRRKNETN